MLLLQKCLKLSFFFVAILFFMSSVSVAADFQFENIVSIDDMKSFISKELPKGIQKSTIRKVFVDEGKATLIKHFANANTEKYIYDMNLCSYYIWRWNISADYDSDNKLQQIYINGLKDGVQNLMPEKPPEGKKQAIHKARRPRPEAHKGESSLAYLLYDTDVDSKRDVPLLIGVGPSRSDPLNMGKQFMYANVDPWRSIFDHDKAKTIVPYKGDCNKVDDVAAVIKNTKKTTKTHLRKMKRQEKIDKLLTKNEQSVAKVISFMLIVFILVGIVRLFVWFINLLFSKKMVVPVFRYSLAIFNLLFIYLSIRWSVGVFGKYSLIFILVLAIVSAMNIWIIMFPKKTLGMSKGNKYSLLLYNAFLLLFADAFFKASGRFLEVGIMLGAWLVITVFFNILYIVKIKTNET